ncbi:MAG: serine/threonine-protein kinase [Planctomycetota bacterium]
MSARQEDFVFAEHVLRRGFATEEQVQECLELLARVRGEMEINETLEGILLKKGYLAQAQSQVIRDAINPAEAGRSRNQIEGYRLLSRLGSGAMGSVYKAQHIKLDILVALKVLRVELAKSTTQVERLKREAQLAARLNHPNIVRSLDVGESNGFHYFAMEFVDGPTARGIIRDGPMREKEALRIVLSVARALEHAHANGVVHRDVKPANIMLSKGGVVKLGDFGLARGQGPSELTLEHAAIGTPQYLAPEQAASAANASPRSDLFSLGATLYHLVTGQPPFSGENLAEIFGKVIQGRFEPPEAVTDTLSIDTLYLIHRLMRPNPRDRYASASDLVADLDRLGRGERIAPPDFKGDYQSFLDRRRQKRLLIGGAAVAVIFVSTWFTASTIQASKERKQALAECQALNDVGEGELDRLATLEEFTQKRDELRVALESRDCAAELVASLKQRVDMLDADVSALGKAEAILRSTEADGANFRTADGEVDDIPLRLEGAQARRKAIKRTLARRSEKRARERHRKVYRSAYSDVDEVIAALQVLKNEFDQKHLPIDEEWATEVGPNLRAIENLKRAHSAARDEHGPRFDEALKDGEFDAAESHLRIIHDQWLKAYDRAVDQGLTEKNFLGLFSLIDVNRRDALVREERRVWEALRKRVTKLDADDRPDQALEELEKFLHKAQRYREAAELEERRLKGRVAALLKQQLREIDELERTFKTALGARQYAAAAALIRSKEAERAWIDRAKTRMGVLRERADSIQKIADRFFDRLTSSNAVPVTGITGQKRPKTAPGTAFRRAEGSDPDRYILRLGGTDYPFALADLGHERLKSILAFDATSPDGLGYFLVAEAYRQEKDPYEGLERLREAHYHLGVAKDRTWLKDVNDEIERLVKKTRDGEESARTARNAFDKARERNDHERALDNCRRLLDELAWTREVTKKGTQELLEKERAKLEGYVTVGMLKSTSGIPPKQYEQPDPEKQANLIRITYTGEEWHPLEKDVPPDATDRRAWLEKNEAELLKAAWEARKSSLKLPEYKRRATHQLLDWSETADVRQRDGTVDPDNWKPLDPPGYVVTVPKPDTTQRAWWEQDWKTFEKSVVHLTNHFRHDANWSVEFTVEWDQVGWKEKRIESGEVVQESYSARLPVYFGVSAGSVQGAIGYFPKSNGGVAGTRIFFDEEMAPREGHASELSDFHWHMAGARNRKDKKQSDRAWLDQLRFATDSPYRVRLERIGSEIHFRFMPLDRWNKDVGFGPVPKKNSRAKHDGAKRMHIWFKAQNPKTLTRAVAWPDTTPAFRFFGRVRFILRDVVVMGYLKDENGS